MTGLMGVLAVASGIVSDPALMSGPEEGMKVPRCVPIQMEIAETCEHVRRGALREIAVRLNKATRYLRACDISTNAVLLLAMHLQALKVLDLVTVSATASLLRSSESQ